LAIYVFKWLINLCILNTCVLHLAELVSYMYITRLFLCSRYYLIAFILQKLCSVTMETKSFFMKTECEIFFPSLIITLRIAVKPSKPFIIQQSWQCCYDTQSEYQELLDWNWHGQIAVLQRRPFECVSPGRRKWRHGQVKETWPWGQLP
jgi:hypothetical protein